MSGATPAGSPASVLPVTSRKLLMLIAALKVPVGAISRMTSGCTAGPDRHRRARQLQSERRPAFGRVDVELTAVRLRDRARDEEAEAETVAAVAVMTSRSKRLEDAREQVAGNAALVVHFQRHAAVVSGDAHAYR